MNKVKDVICSAQGHWLTACRLSHDAEEEYRTAVRDTAHPAVIAVLRDRMIGWKGVEDGATAMLKIIKELDPEATE